MFIQNTAADLSECSYSQIKSNIFCGHQYFEELRTSFSVNASSSILMTKPGNPQLQPSDLPTLH